MQRLQSVLVELGKNINLLADNDPVPHTEPLMSLPLVSVDGFPCNKMYTVIPIRPALNRRKIIKNTLFVHFL